MNDLLIQEAIATALNLCEAAHDRAAENVREVHATEDNELDDLPTIKEVSTFAEAEVITDDHGLVVRLSDGTEYQVTIKRSK